jgi:hypothetical protein
MPEEQAVELYIGMSGINQQTGLAAVVDDPRCADEMNTFRFHEGRCMVEWYAETYCPDEWYETISQLAMEMAQESLEEMEEEKQEEARLKQRLEDPSA